MVVSTAQALRASPLGFSAKPVILPVESICGGRAGEGGKRLTSRSREAATREAGEEPQAQTSRLAS